MPTEQEMETLRQSLITRAAVIEQQDLLVAGLQQDVIEKEVELSIIKANILSDVIEERYPITNRLVNTNNDKRDVSLVEKQQESTAYQTNFGQLNTLVLQRRTAQAEADQQRRIYRPDELMMLYYANSTAAPIEEAPPPTTVAPNAPTNLTATAISSTQINLSWTAPSGTVTGYTIRRATNSGFTTGVVDIPTTTNSYSNINLVAASQYFYKVLASNSAGNSPYSAMTEQTTLAAPPPPPPQPTGSSIKINCGGLTGSPAGWSDDMYNLAGSEVYTYDDAILPGLADDPPQIVLRSIRYGSPNGYDIPNLITGNSYKVVMWFLVVGDTSKEFHIDINNVRVQANYKPYASGDVGNQVKRKEFTVTAVNSQLQIRLILVSSGTTISALSIIPQ